MDLDFEYVPPRRSWMFVPGNRQRFLDKAETSVANAILLDLEDGVLPDDKANARLMVAATLDRNWSGPDRYVRVNAPSTEWLEADLEAVVRKGIVGICLTKVNTTDEVVRTSKMLARLEEQRGLPEGTVKIVAAIESARGLINASAIAMSSPRMVALIFGAEDYALDIGLSTRRVKEAAELVYARSAIVNAAAAASLESIDGVYPDLNDPEGLRSDTEQGRRLGFTGKSTFNPRQLDLIKEVFSPQPHEIEYAREVAEGFRQAELKGDASVAVGGQLVDRPILLRAVKILKEVGEWRS